jgi:small subunit ribosomal protein S4e
VPSKKNYIVKLSSTGKFEVVETKDAGKKPIKIINKTLLKGKKTQLNLIDGRNILSEDKCNTHDSVLFDFKKKKIDKILPMKKGSKAIVVAGKHAGHEGTIENINEDTKIVTIKTKEDKVDALIKQVIVTE